MLANRFLKVVLLLLGGVFVVLQGLAFDFEGSTVGALALVLLTVLYCGWTESKTRYFFWFLIVFMSAQLLSFVAYYAPKVEEGQIDYYYYGANILYIISYLLLILKIISEINLRTVFSQLAIPIIILVILDIFCVTLVTATAENEFSYYQYALEFTYNAIVMALLSFALINYMYRNDNKSMMLLIGSICIVFSEIIQLAYYYILVNDNNLGFIYAFFLVVAFIFFYLQSQLEYTGPEPTYMDERLGV